MKRKILGWLILAAVFGALFIPAVNSMTLAELAATVAVAFVVVVLLQLGTWLAWGKS